MSVLTSALDNVRISSMGASCFPAMANSFCIWTGSLANRNVSVRSLDLSPRLFATFLNLFRKSLNVSVDGS